MSLIKWIIAFEPMGGSPVKVTGLIPEELLNSRTLGVVARHILDYLKDSDQEFERNLQEIKERLRPLGVVILDMSSFDLRIPQDGILLVIFEWEPVSRNS